MKYAFKFSIIVAFHNSENHLKKCIDSIINQSMDFKSNIQLILIDDGSRDFSQKIAKEYYLKYQNNIVFLTQNHEGIAQARNYALKFATGKYINFLDIDDYISKNALQDIYETFEKNYDETDIITLPTTYFENTREKQTSISHEKKGIIDLTKSPNNPLIDISSSFIKSEIIQNFKFETDLIYSEDTLLLNQILINKMKYYIINTEKYFKRNRLDLNNKFNIAINKKRYYTERMKKFHLKLIEYCENEKKEIPKFIQYTIIYDLLSIIKQHDINIFDDNDEIEEFFKHLNKVLLNIDDEIIINNKYLDTTIESYLLFIKYGKIDYEYENSNITIKINDHIIDQLNKQNILFEKIDIINNKLYISGVIYNLFSPNNISISAIKEKNGAKDYYKCSYIKNGHENKRFLSKNWITAYSFDLILPIKELVNSKIRFQINYHKNGNTDDFDSKNIISSNLTGKLKRQCNISNEKNTIFKNSLKVKFYENSIYVTNAYKISVVMAIYNTQNYVKEAINSVIQQDIGFKKNIQLILVDDGSTDNTPQILSEFKNKYPENILIITQKNQGQSTARNNGLKHIQGKYVNFLDSDDYMSSDAMSEAYNFLEKNYDEIDFVSIKQQHFGRKNTDHMLNFRFEEGTRIIDLINEPNNPQLASNAVFFKEHLFRTYKFPTNVISSEDAILVNKILMDKKKYGVLEKPVYYYRKREDLTSTIDTISLKKEFFTEKLKNYYMELINYSIEKEGKVLEFIQYLCAYDLQWMLASPTLDVFETQEEKEEFWKYLDYVIDHIDYNIIAFNPTVNRRSLRNFFIYLKNKEMHVETTANNVAIKSNNFQFDDLVSHNMWIDITTIKDNILYISGHVDSYFNLKHLSFQVLKKNKNRKDEHFIGKYVKYTAREHLTYLSKEWNYNYNFDFEIPLEENDESIISILVNYHKDGNNSNFKKENLFTTELKINFATYGPFSKISTYTVQNSRILFFENNKFYIHKYSYKSMIKHELKILNNIISEDNNLHLKSIFLRILRLIAYPFFKNKKIYLFIDRGDEAGDNAMHLFKYASSIDDDIEKYMILSKEDQEYKKLSKIGNVVDNKSLKHKFLYFFANKIISTHPYHTRVNPFFIFGKNNKRHFTGLHDYKLYFLQHGVTKDNISSWFSKFDKNVSLILTVSDKERDSFLEEGYGYDEKVINTLGFPRFDALTNSSPKKQILIIPTWRKTLSGNKEKFIKSDYFNSLNNLLNNKELINITRDKKYNIILKPHPELNKKIDDEEKFIDLFNIPKEIKISQNETYEELFKNSAIMITDYSSVFFDFAYMKKPVIYYQPNDDYHYEESYFNYETMGFGEVITEEKELVKTIEEYLNNDCIMKDKYKNNVDKFFKYNDDKNCERVYNWIKKN